MALQNEEGMTEGSNHKRVQRKSLCFQRLREEQLRVDKRFSLLSFPAAIFHDRLFNNTVSLHRTPICLMVSPHESYWEICDRFWNGVGCTQFSVAHFLCISRAFHDTLSIAPPLCVLSRYLFLNGSVLMR